MSKKSVNPARLKLANDVLDTLYGDFQIHYDKGVRITWSDYRGNPYSKRWSAERNFYPPFDLPTGGTVTVAICQLIRYVQNRNVLPLTTWEYWAGLKIWKVPEMRDKGLALLRDSDYPKYPICVFCGVDLRHKAWDWYSQKGSKLEGCGCYGGTGCRL